MLSKIALKPQDVGGYAIQHELDVLVQEPDTLWLNLCVTIIELVKTLDCFPDVLSNSEFISRKNFFKLKLLKNYLRLSVSQKNE